MISSKEQSRIQALHEDFSMVSPVHAILWENHHALLSKYQNIQWYSVIYRNYMELSRVYDGEILGSHRGITQPHWRPRRPTKLRWTRVVANFSSESTSKWSSGWSRKCIEKDNFLTWFHMYAVRLYWFIFRVATVDGKWYNF